MTLSERVRALAPFVRSIQFSEEDVRRLSDEVAKLEASEYALEHPLVNALVNRFGLHWPDRIVERFAPLVPSGDCTEIARLLHDMKSPDEHWRDGYAQCAEDNGA